MYEFDVSGNLKQRYDVNYHIIEDFEYDELQRLKKITIDYDSYPEIQYSSNGNIEFRVDAGNYNYEDLNHPNAVTKVDFTENIPTFEQEIGYTSFDMPETILEIGADKKLTFTYGPGNSRAKTILSNELETSILKEKYFFGLYEKVVEDGIEKEINYIVATDGLIAAYIYYPLQPDNSEMVYIHKDYIGSIRAITDETGALIEQHSYDAWGRARNPQDWKDYENVPEQGIIDRGYTGHEMLNEFGLVNMNARLYDPVLGRMLSPDNYISSATNSQALNRYAYCFNNPLKYTDPTGNFPIERPGSGSGGGSSSSYGQGTPLDFNSLGAYYGLLGVQIAANIVTGMAIDYATNPQNYVSSPSQPTQVVTYAGDLVYDDEVDDGNIYILNEGVDYAQMTPDEMMNSTNSTQIVENFSRVKGKSDLFLHFVYTQVQNTNLNSWIQFSDIKWDHTTPSMSVKTFDYENNTLTPYPEDKWTLNINPKYNMTIIPFGNVYSIRNGFEHEYIYLMDIKPLKEPFPMSDEEFETWRELREINAYQFNMSLPSFTPYDYPTKYYDIIIDAYVKQFD